MIRTIACRVIVDALLKQQPFHGPQDFRLSRLPAQERSKACAMIWGTCRYFPRYVAILEQVLTKKLKPKDTDILALIALGWYQQEYMKIPTHAVVNETVETARRIHKSWACGLLNALLRRWPIDYTKNDLTETAHPSWLIKQLTNDWPCDLEAIVEANNQQPPMHLRVNERYHSREAYQKLLCQQGLEATPLMGLKNGLMLQEAVDVYQLPGFEQGWVSIQDASAQWIAELMPQKPNLRVLDACAAPGGKTAAILERYATIQELVAIENNPDRFLRLQQTLNRCQLTASLKEADANDLKSWWDHQSFDVILLDAPCSGTGVIRRHPDIKLIKTPEQITSLQLLQQTLLRTLWGCLKPGGLLFYMTCSVLKSENFDQIDLFLKTHEDVTLVDLPLPVPKQKYGYVFFANQINHGDGFFYSCLKKSPF